MKSLSGTTYKIKDHSIKNLESLGFKYDERSIYGRESYYVRFPVVKYNHHTPIINGEFVVGINDGEVRLNVYDLKGQFYTPFYNSKYGNYEDILLSIINKNMLKRMKKYKIKRKFW